jgi:spermidine synthase
VLGAATIAGLFLAGRASEIFPFEPEATVALRRLYSRWDRTARVDVYELDTSLPELQGRVDGPVQSLLFAQDASAGSFLMGVGHDLERGRALFEHTLYGLGYALGSRRDVLVIGLGGAPDVLTALYHGAARIDAVDINGAAIRLVEDDFRSFLGDPYHRPGVTVHRVDGRAFLQSAAGPYDLVQMSGVDTKAILAAGGLAVNENYIYTREAFRDALARLKPDGILAVLRVVGYEPYRLAALGAAALRDLGVASPERHIFTVAQGLFSATLVKRSPFTGEQLEIGLIQRFVLLLGHQSYAVSVVLCALLVGAGTGSALSARLGGTNARVRAAVIALVAVIGLYAVALGPVLASGVRLSFGARLGLAVVFLVPLGVLLGMPFPSGIDRLRGGSRELVPWAIAVNGFASVVGSTSAVPLAMAFGLRNVLLLGGTLYLVALGALPGAAGEGKRRSPDTAAPRPRQDAA